MRYHLCVLVRSVAVNIAEGYIVKRYVAFKPVRRYKAIVNLLMLIHYFNEPLEAGHTLLKLLKQADEPVYRLHKYCNIQKEGKKVARIYLAVIEEQAACDEHEQVQHVVKKVHAAVKCGHSPV